MFFKANNKNTLTAYRLNLGHTYAQVFLAFIVSLGILFWQMNGLWHEIPYADEVTYMSVAVPLAETGVYKDGTFTGTNGLVGENGGGMFFAPLYPAFLAALAKFDNDLFQTMECSVEHRRPVIIEKECAPLQLKTLVLVQMALMAMAATFAWIAAFIVTGHLGVSWLALLFIFPGKDV